MHAILTGAKAAELNQMTGFKRSLTETEWRHLGLQLMEDLTRAIRQRESVKLQVNETQAELLALKRQA